MQIGIGIGLIAQALTGSSVDALLGGNSLDNYGNAAFLFDVPLSTYRNGATQVGSFSSLTGLTFTRAGGGYAPTSANALTWFNGPRTNLCLQSQTFDNASWTKTNCTITANAIAAPDGATTADKIIVNNGVTLGRPQQVITTVAATAYTFSCFAKAGEWGFVCLRLAEDTAPSAWFDLNTGAVGTKDAGWSSASIETLGDGWYRCSATHTTIGTSYTYRVISTNANGASSTGDGTSGIYAWGAQVEVAQNPANPQPTAYIPTTSAAVTVATQPRITDRGLLIEGARTNLLTYSQDFSNAIWTKSRASISANVIAAPDGTLTASKLVEDTTAAATHRAFQFITKAASAIQYTGSIYFKAGERTFAHITLTDNTESDGAGVGINLTTGELGTAYNIGASPFTSLAVSREVLADGWYRLIITATSDSDTRVNLFAFPATGLSSATRTYTGDGVSGVYLWGAQLEAAAFPSSYIPTTTASVARPADVCSIAVSGISYPATLFAEFERVVDTGSNELVLRVDTGSSNDSALLGVSSDAAWALVTTGGVSQMNQTVGSAITTGSVRRAAMRVAANDGMIASAGVLGTQDTSLSVPAAPTSVNLGITPGGATPFFGFIKRAAVWNGAFTDAQLQAVST